MIIKTLSNVWEKLKVLIYWASWTWKTMFSATAMNKKKTLFISTEFWLATIRKWSKNLWSWDENSVDPYVASIATYADLIELYKIPKKELQQFEVIVVDSITELWNIISIHLMWDTKNTLNQLDWQKVKNEYKKFIDYLKSLNKHIVVVAQEAVERDWEIVVNYSMSVSGFKTFLPYYFDVVARSYKTKKWEYRIELWEAWPSDAKTRLDYINPNTVKDLSKRIDLYENKSDKQEWETIVKFSQDNVFDECLWESGFSDLESAKKIFNYVSQQIATFENWNADTYKLEIKESKKFDTTTLPIVYAFVDLLINKLQ